MPTDWSTLPAATSPDANRALLESSSIHAEALARLEFLAQSRAPLGLLIAPRGCGKSAVLAEFARSARRQGYVVVTSNLAGADEGALLAGLAGGLSLPISPTPGQAWRDIFDRFAELQLENLHAVLLLDDFDRATPSAAAAVERLLAVGNLPLSVSASLLPTSIHRLGPTVCEQTVLRIDLLPWNEAEVGEFLSRRGSGRTRTDFDPAAARRLFELSGGAPRKVHQLALLAEVAGQSQGRRTIDEDTVSAVHEELSAAR